MDKDGEGKVEQGSARDMKWSEEDRPSGAWRRVEDAEEAGWSIDYFFLLLLLLLLPQTN